MGAGSGRSARTWIIVPAAGSGARFAAAIPKQYADLGGRPLLACTLERLSTLGADGTLVALAPDDAHFDKAVGDRTGVVALRCGGATRGATVRNALETLASRCGEDDWILVHDAARPCVPREALVRLVDELTGDATGGLLAVPVADTLKRAEASGERTAEAGERAERTGTLQVLRTESREGWWLAQTPQMFRYRVLREAYRRQGAADCTDEAEAIERLAAAGRCSMPRLVVGSVENIKITRAADLALALAILTMQGDG